MTSPTKTPPNAPPANPASNIIRIVLFVVLGYMVFALAYDYLFVFKAHPQKFEEVQALIEKETSRSAEDREKNGPVTNKEVMEVIGFAPSLPLTHEGHYFHERYTYHRGLPWMTRDIDVFYTGTKEQPILFSAAYMKDDIEESKPRKAVVPDEAPPVTEDKKGEEKKGEEKGTDEKKTEEPAKTDDKKTDEKKTDEPAKTDEKKTEEPAKTDDKKDEAAPASPEKKAK